MTGAVLSLDRDDVHVARSVLRTEAAGLQALAAGLTDSFAAAVERLAAATGRVVVSGMGKSGLVARKIAATLASTGTPALFVHPAEASHGDLGMVVEGDAVLALSNSGETAELADLVAHSRRFGLPLVAITARTDSTLARAADVALTLPAAAEACPMGLAPTTSTTMQMALGDAIAVALLTRRGFTAAGVFASAVPAFPHVVFLDEAAQRDSTRLSPGASPAPMHRGEPDDLFRLMYTSGTTDRPKGVMHSYANFYWKCADHVVALGLGASDRLLIAGPLYHVGAFDLPGMAVLWVGGMIAIDRDFAPERALAAIAREKLTGAWLAPVMLRGILTCPDRSDHDVTSMRWVIGGGERTPEQHVHAFSDFFTRGRYIDAYGMTETLSGDTLMEAGREIEKIGSVGRALAHVEVEIRDGEGRAVEPGVTAAFCDAASRTWKGSFDSVSAEGGTTLSGNGSSAGNAPIITLMPDRPSVLGSRPCQTSLMKK